MIARCKSICNLFGIVCVGRLASKFPCTGWKKAPVPLPSVRSGRKKAMSQSKAQRPVDEFSRLLPHRPPSFSDEEAQNDPAPSPTPLPWPQLAVLAIMRISEPIAFLCIMPFIPQMLQDNMPDVPPEQIGCTLSCLPYSSSIAYVLPQITQDILSPRSLLFNSARCLCGEECLTESVESRCS